MNLDTQWRVGMGGPTGLDHNVMHRELDDLGLVGEERAQMKNDIRAMERTALAVMQESRDG